MFRRIECGPENGGANWSAVRKAFLYPMDSKRCFGIIRAALSLLKSVYDFPHNPKVAGSSPILAMSCEGCAEGPTQQNEVSRMQGIGSINAAFGVETWYVF